MQHRACSGVPVRLLRALQSGSQEEWEEATREVSEGMRILSEHARTSLESASVRLGQVMEVATQQVQHGSTRISRDWMLRDDREIENGEEEDEEESQHQMAQDGPEGAGVLEAEDRAAAAALNFNAKGGGSSSSSGPVNSSYDRGTAEIKKYLFTDEGKEKGTVKVYVKADELEAPSLESGQLAFNAAHVEFQERSMELRAVSRDGRVWVLRPGRLYGPVSIPECRYSLSATGHKVSITLKKADVTVTWHRLTETPGNPAGRLADVRSFI